MSGFAGLSRSRNRKPEGSISSAYARNLRKERAGLVAGQAVLTAEAKDGEIRKLLFLLDQLSGLMTYHGLSHAQHFV